MKLRKHLIWVLLTIVINLSVNNLFSQNVQTKPTRQSSFEAFSKGNYEQAYKEFNELLLVYSKDPLYRYYSGICLIKLNRNPAEAVTLLNQALQGASVVRTLPSDALFYLGRAQQLSGMFTEAVGSYNSYTIQVGKKAAKEQDVPELIQQCSEKKGRLERAEIDQNEIVNNEKIVVSQTENKLVEKETYQKPVEKVPAERTSLKVSYEKILEEALSLQFKADSLNKLASDQKKELEKLSNSEKLALRKKISENELLAASYQKSADQKYSDARLIMNPQPGNAQQDILQQSENKEVKNPVQQPVIKLTGDSIKRSDNKAIKEAVKQSDTTKIITREIKKPVTTFAFFEVLPKPVSDPVEKITVEPEVPEGLIYRIQIAVFRKPVAPAYFKGISPVYGFKVAGTDKTNYYAGMFRRSADAKKALMTVKTKGFKDAFVVAFSGKKPISADRAAIMEKEWGKKPFIKMVKTIIPVDTVPPTLSFRVEVIRSEKPLKDTMTEGIIKVAGSRGLDIQNLDNGKIAYLIGKFITFASASEYANLLIKNGYREARVVAWLGGKEIPVETAKQLFENLE